MDERQSPLKELEAEEIHGQSSLISDIFQWSRTASILVTMLLVLAIGIADYFSGYHIYWSIFYLIAISFAVWNVGLIFALFVSALSIASWLVGDWAAGVVYPNRFVAIWNALITLVSYLVVIGLLLRLKSLHQTLEHRIRKRTSALRYEIATRKQLEKEVAEVTERERRRVGHELHDTVCQHLTATSLSLQVLSGKLAQASLPQAKDVDASIELIEQAIDVARNLAKGLFPLELEGEGLAAALRELCQSTAARYCIKCEFSGDLQTSMLDATTATYLYRIAQEAVANSIKHGHVSRVNVGLSFVDGDMILSVSDDGIGLPEPTPQDRGLGFRIMESRAGMIGARFSAINNSEGGVIVMCRLRRRRYH